MVVFPEEMLDTFEHLDYLFVEIEGLLVPYFINALQVRSDITANIQLNFLDSLEKAKLLIGCKLFTWKENLIVADEGFYLSMLVGYTLIEKSTGQIGPITAVDDFGGNQVLTVSYQNREILIPINEELILKVDPENMVIIMDLPEGLLSS